MLFLLKIAEKVLFNGKKHDKRESKSIAVGIHEESSSCSSIRACAYFKQKIKCAVFPMARPMDRALTDEKRFRKKALDGELVKVTWSNRPKSEQSPHKLGHSERGFRGYIASVPLEAGTLRGTSVPSPRRVPH